MSRRRSSSGGSRSPAQGSFTDDWSDSGLGIEVGEVDEELAFGRSIFGVS
jgi:hypothetical protein